MSQSVPGCKYPEGCTHPLYRDEEYCIFHLPKLTDEQIKKLTPEKALEYYNFEEEFREEFFALLNKINSDPKEKKFNFEGFKFVDIDLSNDKLKVEINRWQGFQKPVYFNRSAFQGANFSLATFQEAHFIGVTFQEADFSGATFQKVHFSNTTFQEANFIEATFKKADFWEATFKKADFTKAIFQKANFTRVTFQADFRGATFQEADFIGGTFKKADFSNAIFQKAVFLEPTFNEKVTFSYSKVQKEITFRGLYEARERVAKEADNRIFKGECEFNRIDTAPEAKIIFEKVNLDQASFLGTNIENFVFRDVNWYGKKPRRIALWDEFENKDVDLSKLADNYHQLVLNYEKKREFDTALEFHIGEMEVRRRLQGTSKIIWFRKVQEWVNAYALYRLMSYYGTSYWRALSVLGVMLLLFSEIFLFFGFQPASISNANISEVINYDWFSPNPASFKRCLLDYWSAAEFSFSILTLQRNPYFEAMGSWSQTFVGCAGIAFYSQVALLLLAIRRRFKQ